MTLKSNYSYDDAVRFEENGDYTKANEILLDIYNQDPAKNHLLIRLSINAMQNNDYDSSIEYALSYLSIDEKEKKLKDKEIMWTIYHHLGVAYSLKENFKKAIKYYQQAIEYENKSQSILYIGECYMNLGKENQGIAFLRTAAKMGNGKAILALNSRGIDV